MMGQGEVISEMETVIEETKIGIAMTIGNVVVEAEASVVQEEASAEQEEAETKLMEEEAESREVHLEKVIEKLQTRRESPMKTLIHGSMMQMLPTEHQETPGQKV